MKSKTRNLASFCVISSLKKATSDLAFPIILPIMLSVILFGAPQTMFNGDVLKLPRRKSRALLYYLAANPVAITRERLLAFFWPDSPRQAAQQVLRTTLHGLRQALGASLAIEDDTIGLDPSSRVDVREFVRTLSSLDADLGTLRAALDLYQGDFLADFSLPDSPTYENWMLVEREHYRRLAIRGMVSISRIFEDAHDFPAALASLERALAFDLLQEDLQRESIRLLYLSGDRPGAIRRYDTLRKLLDEEMGVPPMKETRLLYDAILNDTLEKSAPTHLSALEAGSSRHPRSSSGSTTRLARANRPVHTVFSVTKQVVDEIPFAGRENELRFLAESVATPKLTLVEGEAGIGKTRLIEEYLRTTGKLPIRGTAHELEQSLPYQPVIDGLRGLLARPEWAEISTSLVLPEVWMAEIARLLPELNPKGSSRLGPPSTPVEEARLWEGVQQFLLAVIRSLASRGAKPIVLFFDDLQWADSSTLALLGYLIRQASGPAAFLAAARPVSPRSTLAALLQTLTRSGRLVRLPLARLSPEDITTIAQKLSPQFAYPLANWLEGNAEGNPYILTELVRFGREHGVLLTDSSVNLSVLSSSLVVPQSIYSLVQGRLARISEPARRVLDAGVAAGREFEFDVVYRAAGLSEEAALDAIDKLVEAGLIRSVGTPPGKPQGKLTYVFDHTLTMEVVFREVGEARYRLLHRRIAEAIQVVYRNHLDQVAGLIASHFIKGNDFEQAAPFAIRAGQLAARLGAWKEATGFYEKSLEAQQDTSQRKSILMALGEARFRAGDSAQASETYRDALALANSDSPEADTIRLALAQTFLLQARFAEAIGLVEHIRNIDHPEIVCQAEFVWGTALSLEGADLESAAQHLNEAISPCGGQPSPLSFAEIKFELGSVAAQQGDISKAVSLYRQALEAAQQAAKDPSIGEAGLFRLILSYNNLAYHLHLLGDPSAANFAQTGLDLAREKGVLPSQTYLLSTLGEIALAAKDLDAAERFFSEGLGLAERLAMPERVAGLTANLGLTAEQRGQNDLAIHRFSTALTLADSLGTRHLAAQIRLWLAPLLPPVDGRLRLAEARAIAESSGRLRLLEEVSRLEKTI
jgi:DNA-binding SARP family transcriptional activator/predicted negative regulator of RcsB-dependent stress response